MYSVLRSLASVVVFACIDFNFLLRNTICFNLGVFVDKVAIVIACIFTHNYLYLKFNIFLFYMHFLYTVSLAEMFYYSET